MSSTSFKIQAYGTPNALDPRVMSGKASSGSFRVDGFGTSSAFDPVTQKPAVIKDPL